MRQDQTFGECLTELLRRKRVSVADLTRRMNYRSKTSISRLLRDAVRYSSIEEFMHRLEPVGAWLFNGEEMNALRQAMEVSRLGRAQYRAYQDIWRLVSDGERLRETGALECFGDAQARTIYELAEIWREADRLDMVLINMGFDGLFGELKALLREKPGPSVSIRHYLLTPDAPGLLARQLNALLPILSDERYRGYYLPWQESGVFGGTGSHHMAVTGEYADGRRFTHILTMRSGEKGLLYASGGEADIVRFFAHAIGGGYPEVVSFKTSYPCKELMNGLADIGRQYLNCERDRSSRCLTMNVCFELIPPELLKRVMLESTLKGMAPENAQVRELEEIHRARYTNIHGKKKRSSFVFSREGLETFVRTGLATDHIVGMRPFTPAERAEILRDVVRKCRENVYLTVRILKPSVRVRDMTLTVYEDLGVSLMDARTGSDVLRGHSEAFFMLPDFAAVLTDFFRDELFDRHTCTEAESLEMMEALAKSAEE